MKWAPRYVLCQRPGCGGYAVVRKPSEQGKRKYCSRRCANIVNYNITPEECGQGGTRRAARSRARLVTLLTGLTVLEAFRLGYTRGLQSKTRQLLTKHRRAKPEAA